MSSQKEQNILGDANEIHSRVREATRGMKVDDQRTRIVIDETLQKAFDDGLLSAPHYWIDKYTVDVKLSPKVCEFKIDINFTREKL